MRALLRLSLVFWFLSACVNQVPTPRFASNSGSNDFEGIVARLSPDRPTDVLLVHGMCTHDMNWAKSEVASLGAMLGEGTGERDERTVSVQDSKVELYQRTLHLKGGNLRANAIVWSALTTPLKASLCYDQTKKSETCPESVKKKTYPYPRAKLNSSLKDSLLNDCLADVLIYQGKSRQSISKQIQQTILLATATSGGDPAVSNVAVRSAAVPSNLPLIIITDSLGSKIVFDAVYQLVNSPERTLQDAGKKTFARAAQIFMRANQLPILTLADKGLDDSVGELSREQGAFPEDPLAALLNSSALKVMRSEDGRQQPQIVAFTDPNDLLSYALSGSGQYASPEHRVVDVVRSNDGTLFGLAENPLNAHRDYGKNEDVRRFIACGSSSSVVCK